MKITIEPPFEQWTSVLQENLSRSAALQAVLGADRVTRVRSAIAEEASRYTDALIAKAKEAGIPIAHSVLPSYEASKPVVSVGHQPLIYHWGLIYKNLKLSALARETNSLGINSVIDTDVGDAGRILWPRVQDGKVSVQEGSIGEGPELFMAQRVLPRERLKELFSRMRADLMGSGASDAAAIADQVADYYARLSGESVVVANSLVRWVFEERYYLEVPLSRIVKLPEVSQILDELMTEYRRVVGIYNETLNQYRLEHKIKNAANPFPNMKVEGERFELPLWEVSEAERAPLYAEYGKVSRRADSFIAPRGSIVTLLMRGYCGDIAVHGLGGARYDPFVDAFARALHGVDLPKYVVASATRYLFPDVVSRYERARDLKARYKEMVSHTQKFFGQSLFSPEDEEALEPLVQRRTGLLEALKVAENAEQKSSVAHQLNALNREIKARIDTSAVAPLLADGSIDEATFSRWACREYPFFLINGGRL